MALTTKACPCPRLYAPQRSKEKNEPSLTNRSEEGALRSDESKGLERSSTNFGTYAFA